MKNLVHRALALGGYEIRRVGNDKRSVTKTDGDPRDGDPRDHEIEVLRERLAWSETLRNIHKRDCIEIEELLRRLALPDLPRREGRESQLANLVGTNVCEGLYVVMALHEALQIEGDICEFGVAQGATSALIASEIMHTDRQFYLFDSFEGLPPPTKEDRLIDDVFNLGSMEAYTGTMVSPETEVLSRLKAVGFAAGRTHIRKGWVDQTLAQPNTPRKVAFAYVDFDFYQPIKVALDWLDQHMDAGARIVVDDYGFFSEGAQLATDEFIDSSGGRWIAQKPLDMAGHFVTLSKVRS